MSGGETTQILGWVDRLRAGDASAMGELLVHFETRLIRLTRKMLRTFPAVRRWEQSDDVFQGAAMRLRRALKGLTPGSTREFFQLAALQVRRELLDLAAVYRHRGSPSRLGQVGPGRGSASKAAASEAVDDKEQQGDGETSQVPGQDVRERDAEMTAEVRRDRAR